MRPSFIGSSPFQEESFTNYTIARLHFPVDSGGTEDLECLEFFFFLGYKVLLGRRSNPRDPRRYSTLSDFVEKRKLPRIEVRWPVTMMTEKGSVEGEARNITVEGVFIHCMEKLSLNETYRLLMNPAGEKIEVMGKLVWSNLDSAADRDILPGMGFCFVKVSEGDREFLREAIQKYSKK
jgi:PilZ domain